MAKMRAVDAAMYVLKKKGLPPHSACLAQRLTPFIPPCVSTAGSAIFWLATWKARPIWPKAIRVPQPVISAYAWGHRARRERI